MTPSQEDSGLLTRLRDLSLVDLDALLAGTSDERYSELLITYADDLADALRAARDRARELTSQAFQGPDPLILLDASPDRRGRGGGREAGHGVTDRLGARAPACVPARITTLGPPPEPA